MYPKHVIFQPIYPPGFRVFLVGRTSLEGQPQDQSMMILDGRDGIKDKLKMGCADVHHTDLYLISSFITTKLWVATPHPLWPWVPAHGPVLKDRHSVAPRRMGKAHHVSALDRNSSKLLRLKGPNCLHVGDHPLQFNGSRFKGRSFSAKMPNHKINLLEIEKLKNRLVTGRT